MVFEWDEKKNKTNLAKHGITFEQVVEAIWDKKILEEGEHPHTINYPGQYHFKVIINDFTYFVACEKKDGGVMRIISAYPEHRG